MLLLLLNYVVSFSIITKSKVTNNIYIIHEHMHEGTVLTMVYNIPMY